jgi:hypothetical protein
MRRHTGPGPRLRFYLSSRSRCVRHGRVPHNDDGAILVLALVFMIITSLTIVTLSSWAGNSLVQAQKFGQASDLNYATGAVVQMEAQDLRYTYQPTSTSFYACTPGSGTSITINSVSVVVYCFITDNADSSATRVVTLDACSSSSTATSCQSNPYLQATYSFDDYSESNVLGCISTSDEITCGSGMSITGWDVL